jgi:hypothetical protein
MDDVMTDVEVRAFGDKLKNFGDQLTPKEQALLAEIVMRAAAFEADVEGHAFQLPRLSRPAWREVRQQISGVVRQIAADYHRGASFTSLERPYIHHES